MVVAGRFGPKSHDFGYAHRVRSQVLSAYASGVGRITVHQRSPELSRARLRARASFWEQSRMSRRFARRPWKDDRDAGPERTAFAVRRNAKAFRANCCRCPLFETER